MSGTFQHLKVVKEMVGRDVLMPWGITGNRAIKKIILGRVGVAEIYTSRNPLHLNKFFALLAKVADATGWNDPEELRRELMIRLSFVDEHGEPVSLRLTGGMTQEQFQKFYDLMVETMIGILHFGNVDEKQIAEFYKIHEGRGNEYDDGSWVDGY
jgi:hypothetical protein